MTSSVLDMTSKSGAQPQTQPQHSALNTNEIAEVIDLLCRCCSRPFNNSENYFTGMVNSGLPDNIKNNGFEKAQAQFLATLSPEERQNVTICMSADDLVRKIEQLNVIALKGPSAKRWLSVIARFAKGLEPFFKFVDVFVAFRPEYTALYWGSFSHVLQMAVNYTSFFEKLTSMLATLTDALPQYEDVYRICIEQGRGHQDDADTNVIRIRSHLERVYQDIFKLLRVVAGVFTKPDGKEKSKLSVARSIIWKPFEMRFNKILDNMATHRRFIFEQLVIWQGDEASKEIARAAAEREIRTVDRQDEAEERRLAEEERFLMREEREQSSEHRHKVTALLFEIKNKLRQLENDRKDKSFIAMQQWVAAPGFAGHLEKALKLRVEGTALWFLEEVAYSNWKDRKGDNQPSKTQFGANILWVQVIDELAGECAVSTGFSVYYYFFDHRFSTSHQPSDAYRAIIAQLMWKERKNTQLLDRFTFLVDEKSKGGLVATEGVLLDLLQLCLTEDVLLVLDGIDECEDSESLVKTLVKIANHLPKLRIMLFSRINVAALKIAVPLEQICTLSKSRIAQDILCFCLEELEDMFEQNILPSSHADQKTMLADRLCTGADGMFLWARLMTRYLRSPFLTKQSRLNVINQVNLPEGLEKVYERIVTLIQGSGTLPVNLASTTLTWIAFAVTPVTTRQLRQAIAAQGNTLQASISSDVSEFEECVVMACAGLIETGRLEPNAEWPRGESTLRFIHLSLQEIIQCQSPTTNQQSILLSPSQSQGLGLGLVDEPLLGLGSRGLEPSLLQWGEKVPTIFQCLVPRPAIANLAMTLCCLRQLLYYTPAQPLSGTFNRSVSEAYMTEHHCFTLYAAVHWLGHLNRCLEFEEESSSKSISLMLVESTKILSTFLSKPPVLSAWLEAFYTAKCQRQAVGYNHPPVRVVQKWIESITERSQREQPPAVKRLQEAVNELVQDMDIIENTWDTKVGESPEIIWDEMTYFAKTRLFFSPESLKVSIQDPEPPKHADLSPDPVARMARTSANGEIKGVLSIWGPRVIHDRKAFTRLRTTNLDKYQDVRPLCEGWFLTYHVWRLEKPDKPAAKIEIPLDADEVLEPLLKYLDYPITDGIDFPLAVSPDAMSFCVLGTLYMIQVEEGQAGTRIFTGRVEGDRVSGPGKNEPDFLWKAKNCSASTAMPYSYRIDFSPASQCVALHESYGDGSHTFTISTYSYTVDVGFLIKKVNNLHISNQENQISHLTFHPSRPLLVFHARFSPRNMQIEKAIFIWHFKRTQNQLAGRQLPNYWGVQSAAFSVCGTYLVLRRDFPTNAEPVVIPCPDPTPEDDEEACVAGLHKVLAPLTLDSQPADLRVGKKNTLSELVSAKEARGVTLVSQPKAGGTEVFLTRKAEGKTETAKVVAFPSTMHFDGAVHTAVAPKSLDDTFKVSIDMDRRPKYSLIEPSAELPAAAVIERHPAFVTATSASTSMVKALMSEQQQKGKSSANELDMGKGWVTCRRVEPNLLTGSHSHHEVAMPKEPVATIEDKRKGNGSQGQSSTKSDNRGKGAESSSTLGKTGIGIFGAAASVLGWFRGT